MYYVVRICANDVAPRHKPSVSCLFGDPTDRQIGDHRPPRALIAATQTL